MYRKKQDSSSKQILWNSSQQKPVLFPSACATTFHLTVFALSAESYLKAAEDSVEVVESQDTVVDSQEAKEPSSANN